MIFIHYSHQKCWHLSCGSEHCPLRWVLYLSVTAAELIKQLEKNQKVFARNSKQIILKLHCSPMRKSEVMHEAWFDF